MTNTTANNTPAIIDQQKDLAHLSDLQQEIVTLKEGYTDLIIESPDDKEGYEKIKNAIATLRGKRTGAERERKDMVAPYNATVKFINGKYDEVETLILSGPGGESELKSKKESVDEIVEKAKEEKKRQEEEKINNRINELLKHMTFDGSYYSIKDEALGISETSIGVVEIRTMSDELFTQFLQMVMEKTSKISAEKERVEAIAKKQQEEKEAADKKEREEFAAAKKALDEQAAAMKKHQDDIAAAQQKLDNEKREAEAKEKQIEQNRVNDLIKHRSAVLVGMGMKYNSSGDTYNFEEIEISTHWLTTATEGAWIESVQETTDAINVKKDAATAKALQEQAEQKRKQDEAKYLAEKERLAGMKDIEKMREYLANLMAVPVPEFTTKKYKGIAGMVRDYIINNKPS